MSMARVILISVVLAFLFIQLAYSQDACQDALTTLANNAASCTPTAANPTIICSGECEGYYDDIIDYCTPEVSKLTI